MNTNHSTIPFRFRFAGLIAIFSATSIMFCSCQSSKLTRDAQSPTNQRQPIPVSLEDQPVPVVEKSEAASADSTETHGFNFSDRETPHNETQSDTSLTENETVRQVAYVQEYPSEFPAVPSEPIENVPYEAIPPQTTITPQAMSPLPEYCPTPMPAPTPMPGPAFGCPVECPPIPRSGIVLPPPVALEVKSSFSMSDEYLCDGGDRNRKVTIGDDFSIKGLDIEDTVVHFDSLDGKRMVQPSNRVCVYAPRFAAVRKTYGVALSAGRQQIAKADKTVGSIDQRDMVVANTTLQHAQPVDNIGSELAQSFIDQSRSNMIDQGHRAMGTDNFIRPHSGEHLLRFSRMDQAQKARLAREAMKAEFWTDNQAAQVVVKGQTVARAISSQRLQDITGSEERVSKQNMRIIKSASKGAAKPGDLIEFTLRFENLSNEKVGNVTIIDNLTPRLEYVPDSQSCSVKADFIVTDNEGDSLLLRWEIIDPMDPDTSGEIRFKCLVR